MNNTEEYQRFVLQMAKHCQCRANNCPCYGVLLGGLCDMVQDAPSSLAQFLLYSLSDEN